eukprot:jgi/Mesen1/4438/ME000225S03427
MEEEKTKRQWHSNPYFNFVRAHREQAKAQLRAQGQTDSSVSAINKVLGDTWRNLSAEEKQVRSSLSSVGEGTHSHAALVQLSNTRDSCPFVLMCTPMKGSSWVTAWPVGAPAARMPVWLLWTKEPDFFTFER